MDLYFITVSKLIAKKGIMATKSQKLTVGTETSNGNFWEDTGTKEVYGGSGKEMG